MADTHAAMRGRLDLTETIQASDRRLDSLAKLLAIGSNSICVAVSMIGGELVVASNEFFSRTRDNNEKKKKIKNILDYFRRVAKNKPSSPDERRALFLEICKGCKSGTTEPSYADKLGNDKFKILVDYLFDQDNPTISEFKKIFSEKYKVAWAAYAEMRAILQALTRVEEGLDQQNSELVSEPFIEACKKDFKILKTEPKQGVHAEVQILADLIRNITTNSTVDANQEIYIGISKLCCLECRVMLKESTEPLQEAYSINLKFRGHHDLSFDDNWIVPQLFSEGYNAEEDVISTDLMFQIGKNARRKIEELSVITMARVNQSPLPTASNPSPTPMELEPSEGSVAYFLEELLQKIRGRFTAVEYVEQAIDEKILMVIDLLKIETFKDLLHSDDLIGNSETEFQAILEQLKQTKPEVSQQSLLEILKNKKLVGAHIAEHFERIGFGIVQEVTLEDPSGLRSRLIEAVPNQGLSEVDSDMEDAHGGVSMTFQRYKRQAENEPVEMEAKKPKMECDPEPSLSKVMKTSSPPRSPI